MPPLLPILLIIFEIALRLCYYDARCFAVTLFSVTFLLFFIIGAATRRYADKAPPLTLPRQMTRAVIDCYACRLRFIDTPLRHFADAAAIFMPLRAGVAAFRYAIFTPFSRFHYFFLLLMFSALLLIIFAMFAVTIFLCCYAAAYAAFASATL